MSDKEVAIGTTISVCPLYQADSGYTVDYRPCRSRNIGTNGGSGLEISISFLSYEGAWGKRPYATQNVSSSDPVVRKPYGK
jgi:hypothetical protein